MGNKHAEALVEWMRDASAKRELLPWNVIDEAATAVADLAARCEQLIALAEVRATALREVTAERDELKRTVYVPSARTIVPQAAVTVVAALGERLSRIIIECHNETSGAEEDKHRDTILAHIINIAEGRAP